MYKKRPGTSGLHGQFYETKALSLLNFRAQHDDDIEEFHLATNVDLIGDFDDICFRAKVKGFDKDMAVFVQTKHKETTKQEPLNIKHEQLVTYFESYLKIRRKFGSKKTDKLFGGAFSETECLFVFYTNAKYAFENDLVETEYTDKLKELIGAGKEASYLQPTYNSKDLECLSKIILEQEVVALAEHFAKLLNKEVMMDELVSCYHYILAQEVFEVSDAIENGYRIARFRKYFFDSNEHFVLIFKNTLYKQVLLKRKMNMRQTCDRLEKLLSRTSDDSEVEILSELIGSVIVYKNGKFECIKDVPNDLKRQLDKVSIPQSTADEAIDRAARKILEQSTFRVLPSFGNTDLTIRGNEADVENRLILLSSKIVGLINDAKPHTIITIDESVGDSFLKASGGLAGAVGNVFVADENSRSMKFADNVESIKGELAKRLYLKLQKEVINLSEYKINVNVKKFPKLSFDSGERDENLVKEFLRQLIFCTNQSNEKEIGEDLTREIENHSYDGMHIFQVKAHAVFLKYLNRIQEWWKESKKPVYLTKHDTHFEEAIKDIVNQPLISVLNVIHTFKMQNVLNYSFNAAAVSAFKLLLDEQCKADANVIVTDYCKFTVAKLTQYLNNAKHAVLDLESILNLLPKHYKTLRTELAENKETIIIVNYGDWCQRLNDIVKVVKARLYIVTKGKPNKMLYYVNDFANNLIDLSDESQHTFLENTNVMFQEAEVSLGRLIRDEKAKELIKGDIFQTMLENTTFEIGMPLGNGNYEKFKQVYIDRRISRIRKTEEDTFEDVKNKIIQTLNDLQDHVVLVTAMPGMGKSTLLTHLSTKTKELDPSTWIVRINLLEYSDIFRKWQENKTVIDPMLSLYFVSCVALGVAEKNITAELLAENNVVYLKYCSGDASIIFLFEMFLHFYNSGTLIFLFDGFDEIFPHYADEALSLVKFVRSYPRQHKIWITSRSYNNIKEILEQEFGRSYEIEQLSEDEQTIFLIKNWMHRVLLQFRHESHKAKTMSVPTCRPIYTYAYHEDKQITVPYFRVFLPFTKMLETETLISQVDNYTRWRVRDTIAINTDDFFATPLHLYLLVATIIRSDPHVVPSMVTEPFTLPDGKPALFGSYDHCVPFYTKNKPTFGCHPYIEVTIYELCQKFVEVKLEKIRFEEKNKIVMSIADNRMTYDIVRADVVAKHKKLGAYAIFYPDVNIIFNENELKELMKTIGMLKSGEEKSGFIHSVAGDVPLFIHRLIAEFFAAEFLDDLLKTDITDETRTKILGIGNIERIQEILASKHIVNCSDSGEPVGNDLCGLVRRDAAPPDSKKNRLVLVRRSLTPSPTEEDEKEMSFIAGI